MNKEKINKTDNKDELNKEINEKEVNEKEVSKEVLRNVSEGIDIDDNSLDIYADEEKNGVGYELKVGGP